MFFLQSVRSSKKPLRFHTMENERLFSPIIQITTSKNSGANEKTNGYDINNGQGRYERTIKLSDPCCVGQIGELNSGGDTSGKLEEFRARSPAQ